MGFDSENRKKKCFIAGVVMALLVVIVVAVAVITTSENVDVSSKHVKESEISGDVQIKTTSKAVQAVCAPTDYRETCFNSLMKASPNSTQPLSLIKLGFDVTIRSINDSIKKASVELKAKAANDKETEGALDLCESLMTDATDDLKKCLDKFDGFSITQIDQDFVEDLRVWLSGSIAYQQTCMDTFEEIKSNLSEDMHKIFKTSQELTSNGLAMVTHISSLLGKFNITGLTGDLGNYARKLLSTEDGMPSWVTPHTRRLMAAQGGVKANVVVAQDGTGQYKTINEALNVVPKANKNPFVIYIKQGLYNEQVNVTKKMTHVTFIGDGPTKTKITGSLNYHIGHVKPFLTATVAIDGDNFFAKNIGFENTAGPEGHQAVALRVSADSAVFHNCQIDGYQDTLYVHAYRQFFRNCTVSGTVDFIFGDATVVLQNCNIVVRKPMKGQSCTVTAQSRTSICEATGIVLQNCHITGEPAYIPVKSINKAYLGRPWQKFSRTIIMGTTIDDVIDPAGWLPWNGSNFALDTLFYAEYENSGPGSNQTQRVKWAGIKKLSPEQALQFTPARFLRGDFWIPPNRVPYMANL